MHLNSKSRLFAQAIKILTRSQNLMAACTLLSIVSSMTAAFSMVLIVIPAAIAAPKKWMVIAIGSALGCAIGGTALAVIFHHLGWAQIYHYFPEFHSHATWQRVMTWVSDYGLIGLFLIALSPLPQTPALLVLAIIEPNLLWIPLILFVAKFLKYGFLGYVFSQIRGHLGDRLRAYFSNSDYRKKLDSEDQ